VDNAVVERFMPNKIRITIEESDSIAYVNIKGEVWSLDHSMRYLEKIADTDTAGKIQIKGIEAADPIIGTKVNSEHTENVSDVLDIMTTYGLLPYVTWLAVSTAETAEFDYLDRFTVKIPINADMEYNFEKLLAAVNQLSPGDRALLDLTIDDNVHFSPR
ncbi:MAG: hypothetical protein VB106_17935, partial [Clostridiaceae bacterium]|nr:hypothetical protein [Clostridiaceae bacterium]